jgi:putative inorganic carbon (HCO3(-)) transporter
MMEILGAVWLVFVISYPAYRPKFSYISFGLGAFFLALLTSTIFSVDFNLSFWGDIERMLGWFHLFHFLIFYFIIITVFREWKDWQKLFIAFTLTAFYVSLVGILQHFEIVKSPYGSARVVSVIGNAAYVGSFAIFSLYFTGILFVREKSAAIKVVCGLVALAMFLLLLYSGTRGAYLGFAAGVTLAFLIFAIFGKSRKLKILSLSGAIVVIIAGSLLMAFKNSAAIMGNPFLSRVTHISLSDPTLNTRFISWKAALKDFPNHPILGTGFGNFAVTFDKYFDPKFYDFTKSETYFDRAHNNLIDIASTAGLFGLLSYLSVFAAAGYYLVSGLRKEKISLSDFSLMTTLIIAYFIQNLVVFDALATYIPLMIMLGYIYFLSSPPLILKGEKVDKGIKGPYLPAVIGLIALFVIYQYNIKPLFMLKGTIDGQYAIAAGEGLEAAAEKYKKALSYNTPLDRDSRNTFVRSIMQNYSQLEALGEEESEELLKFAISQAEKNVGHNPGDSMNQMTLGQILNLASGIVKDKSIAGGYSLRAEEAINKSIEASPGRAPIYFEKAQIYLTRGNIDEAIKILDYAVSLNENYPDGYCHLSRIYLFKKDEAKAFSSLDKCLDLGGAGTISSLQFVLGAVGHYQQAGDTGKVIALLSRAGELDPKNSAYPIELAKIYAQAGDRENAKAAAKKAGEIDPGVKDAADAFIRELGN